MKFVKYALLSAVTAMTLALGACNATDDYGEYAPGTPGVGVYFHELGNNVQVLPADKSFTVKVGREGLTEAVSYEVVFSTDCEGITAPAAVTFAENSSEAEIVLALDGDKMDSNVPYTVSLALKDAPADKFGSTSIEFTITRAYNWGEEKEFGPNGLCTWAYDLAFVFDGLDPDLPILQATDQDNENHKLFHIQHWGRNVDLYIDYDATTNKCHIEPQLTGEQINVTGIGILDVYIQDMYTWTGDPEDDISTFDPETNLFELAVVYCVINPANGKFAYFDGSYGIETCQVGEFKDYSVSLKYSGVLFKPDDSVVATFNTTIGESATEAIYAIGKDMNPQALLQAMLTGAVPTVSAAPGQNLTVEVPIAESGDYVAVAITLDGDEAMNAAATSFTANFGSGGNADDGNWENCAVVEITDAWVTAGWSFTNRETGEQVTYDNPDLMWLAQAQKDLDHPGVYRLVSPWTAANCPVSAIIGNLNTKKANIVIDASNEQLVKIVPQYSGFTWNNKGTEESIYIGNRVGTFASLDIPDELLLANGITQEWNDGDLSINPALFGYNLDLDDDGEYAEFGYSWNSKPTAVLFFDFAQKDLQSSPAKVRAALRGKLNLNRINNAVKSKFALPAQASFPLSTAPMDATRFVHVR